MIQSITQDNQNDKILSEKIQSFFKRFHVTSALKAANAYKKKGFPVASVFQYLFLLVFSNRSMYMSLMLGRNLPGFCKDTAYRFMKMDCINWIRFTTILSSRIVKKSICDLTSDQRVNAFVIDDSMFERGVPKRSNCSQKSGIMQKPAIAMVSVCLHSDGPMGPLFHPRPFMPSKTSGMM